MLIQDCPGSGRQVRRGRVFDDIAAMFGRSPSGVLIRITIRSPPRSWYPPAPQRSPGAARLYFSPSCPYALGLHQSEVRNLRWKDINWQRQAVQMLQKGGCMKSLPMGMALPSALREIVQPGINLKDIKTAAR